MEIERYYLPGDFHEGNDVHDGIGYVGRNGDKNAIKLWNDEDSFLMAVGFVKDGIKDGKFKVVNG